MKYIKNILALTLILFLWACTCEEDITLIPEAPDPFLVTNIEMNGNAIYIHFNKFVDPTSPDSINSLQVIGEGISYTGVFFVDDDAIIIPACQIQCPTTDCNFQLLLSGLNNSAIKSTAGQILDGNKDGTDGGDYLDTLSIKSCQFPEITCGPEGISYANNIFRHTILTSFCFSEPMDSRSVTDGNSLKIISTGGQVSHSSLKWVDNNTQLDLEIFPLCNNPQNPTNGCDCSVDFSLNGNLVKSRKGINLDGDGNGFPGGIYKSTIEIQQLAFPSKGFFTTDDGTSVDFTTTFSDDILTVFKINFNSPIDTSTIEIGKNLILIYVANSELIPINIFFNNENTELILITKTPLNPDLRTVKIQLIQKSLEVLDQCHGKAIDGNRDGKPGGDFSFDVKTF